MRVNGYYNVGSIFDVSLTYGNKPYPIPEIKPEQMDKAIKELERLSPVNIIFQNEALSGTMPSNTRLCSQRPCRSVKCWHDCPPKSSLQPQSSTGRVSPKLPIYEKRRWQYRWNFVVGFLCRYPIPLPLFWTGWIPTFHPRGTQNTGRNSGTVCDYWRHCRKGTWPAARPERTAAG